MTRTRRRGFCFVGFIAGSWRDIRGQGRRIGEQGRWSANWGTKAEWVVSKVNAPATCLHCGTPVPASREGVFCCSGCAFVHDLLHREGLDHFYDLRGGKMLPPVPLQAMRERDDSWLQALARLAADKAAPDGVAELSLAVQGLSCVGCVWLLERVFSRHEGGVRLDVDVVRGELRIAWRVGAFDVANFAGELQDFGYLVGPPRKGSDAEHSVMNGLERRMGLCGAFAMNAMAFSLPRYFGMPEDFVFAHWFELVTVVSATLALLVGGTYFAERAWRGLRAGVLHIDTPIALGVFVAYGGSMVGWLAGLPELKYFDFVGTFIFLMLAGRWAQQAAVERNRRRLMRDTSIPEHVSVLGENGEWEECAVGALTVGCRFRVKLGQTVPVASRLESPNASVSLEWINGESEARSMECGQMLPSGALNIRSGEIEVVALEDWEGSTLRRLLDARKPSEARDHLLERVLRVYLVAVLVIGVAGACWWWMSGESVARALQVMISIFVVSCPCALGVAIPLADEMAASQAERLGVFVRQLGFWRRLNRVRRVVFDKTGTLTLENPVLENTDVIGGMDAREREALRTLVTGNLHPVSRSLFDAVGPGALCEFDGTVEEVIGQGTLFRDSAGVSWALGKPGWKAGGTGDVVLSRDDERVADFGFRDALRSESVEECDRLRSNGIEVCILSGDRPEKVVGIALALGLTRSDWEASMTPEAKADWIAAHDGDATLYVGDGANDSLAFDAALCAGSPVSGRSFLEQKADFFFMGHSLRFVSNLMKVADRHRRATKRAFVFAVVYNVVAVGLGLSGALSPVMAAILMPLSSVATLGLVSLSFASRSTKARGADSSVVASTEMCPAPS